MEHYQFSRNVINAFLARTLFPKIEKRLVDSNLRSTIRVEYDPTPRDCKFQINNEYADIEAN